MFYAIHMSEDRFQYETCRWTGGLTQAKLWFDELELTGPLNIRSSVPFPQAEAVPFMGGNKGRSKEEGANFRLRGDAIFRCTIHLRFPSWADWFEAASASTSIAMASYSSARVPILIVNCGCPTPTARRLQ
jgi:hypothetical protein